MAKFPQEMREKYQAALLDAFRKAKELEDLYRTVFNRELSNACATDASLEELTDCILSECSAQDRCDDLILAANAMNPTNRKLQKLAEEIQQKTALDESAKEISAPSKAAQIEQKVGFVNRKKELESIFLTPGQISRYWVIDAPAGYGKTQLLAEVGRRYKEDGWLTVSVTFPRNADLSSKKRAHPAIIDLVANPIIENLRGHSDVLDMAQTLEEIGMKISSAILVATRNKTEGEAAIKGIAITVDNFEKCPDDEIQGFVQMMSGIFTGLKNNNAFFTTKHLRVFIAGRYARNKIKNAREQFMMADIPLAPFTFEVIAETIQELALSEGNPSPHQVEDIAAHLMHITGGHPDFTGAILNSLAQDGFTMGSRSLARNSLQYQDSFTRSFYSQLHGEAPMLGEHELIDILVKLSPFRKYDRWSFLKELKEWGFLPADLNEEAIEKGLLNTYLVDREGGFLHDGIYRYLLEIWLRRQQPKLYADLCDAGIEIYRKQIERAGGNIRRIEKWAIEYIYLCIVKNYHVKGISGGNLAQEANKDVSLVIDAISKMKANLSESDFEGVREDFMNDLSRDAELRFLFNFCTSKDDFFNVLAYENLLSHANQEFDKFM